MASIKIIDKRNGFSPYSFYSCGLPVSFSFPYKPKKPEIYVSFIPYVIHTLASSIQ